MKKLYFLLLLVMTSIFFSCASVQSANFPPDGVYSYDFEHYVDCIEAVYIYKSCGMDAYQNMQKKSWGNAVLMQGGLFVEPETGILISISQKGAISSPENPSFSGTYKKNGDFFFQGYYEENNQINKISVSGKLLFSDKKDRASSSYDGDFILTDNGTARKQKVKIENGLYIWEYAEKQDDDFETWPVIVSADGAISCGFEMTVQSGIKGFSEMLVSSICETIGRVGKDGTIGLKTLTRNYGTGQSGEDSVISYSGIRGTENFNQIQKARAENSKITEKLMKSKGRIQNPKKENPPEWYSDFIPNNERFLYGTARKTHDDKDTALKIAELTAVSQIKSYLAQNVASYTEAQKSMSQGSRGASSFFSAIDSFSFINLPYTVENSVYDEKTKTAYMVVRLERSEGEKGLMDFE
ncbi:hypothetical protein [Treponema sp.]|uniref:hypothetical protein n=1 Tax=Treponema sp. TaxID=166 RepID=UPI003F1051EC